MSKQYFDTESDEIKQQLLSAGHGFLAKYKGTSFDVYYVLNAITLLMISKTMLKSNIFGKNIASWGLLAGFFMIIPSTAGTLGLIFSLISLVPWTVFSVLTGKKLFSLAKTQE